MSGVNGSAGLGGLSSAELREAVRSVLRDVLPDLVQAAGTSAHQEGAAEPLAEAVVIQSDADLAAFVRRLLELAEDPRERAALEDGRRRFRLVQEAPAGTAALRDAVLLVERGAVTERRVSQAAAQGARLVVGPRAVLTPLARDRARALGVVVEKER